MGLYDAFETGEYVLGTATTPVTLTADYADNGANVAMSKKSHAFLYVAYTMGTGESSNSIQVKVEYSTDGSTFHRKTNESRTAGATTLTLEEYTFSATGAAATYDYFVIELKEVCSKVVKVSVKETGIAANGGSCSMRVSKGGK